MKTFISLSVLAFSLSGFAASANELTDAQTVKVVNTVNNGEIELAKYVMKNTKNDDVKKFAEGMIKDHTMNNQTADKLAHEAHIRPVESAKSRQFKIESEQSKMNLTKLKGSELDKAYINDQISAHQKVLNELNGTLIPDARNEQLKQQLQKTAKRVEQHLNEAKDIQRKLM